MTTPEEHSDDDVLKGIEEATKRSENIRKRSELSAKLRKVGYNPENPLPNGAADLGANTCASGECGKGILEHTLGEYAAHGNPSMSQARARRLFGRK